MPRKPQDLDRFSPVERRVIERVRDTGEITIPFATKNMAYNYKYRMLRFIHALRAHDPHGALTAVASIITVKLRDNILTLTRKDSGDEAQAVLAVLDGLTDTGHLNADQQLQFDKEEEDSNLAFEAIGLRRRNASGKWEDVPYDERPEEFK